MSEFLKSWGSTEFFLAVPRVKFQGLWQELWWEEAHENKFVTKSIEWKKKCILWCDLQRFCVKLLTAGKTSVIFSCGDWSALNHGTCWLNLVSEIGEASWLGQPESWRYKEQAIPGASKQEFEWVFTGGSFTLVSVAFYNKSLSAVEKCFSMLQKFTSWDL